jgi:hypothetical protein
MHRPSLTGCSSPGSSSPGLSSPGSSPSGSPAPSATPLPALPRLLLGAALKRRGSLLAAQDALTLLGSYHHPGLDHAHQARYRAALGFAPEAPPPLCLAYLPLQQAQLALMLQAAFPYRLLGMVHLAQQLRRLGPWRPDQPLRLDLQLRIEPATPRGRREALIQASLSQQAQVCLSAESRYLLERGRRDAPSDPPSASPSEAKAQAPGDPAARPLGDWFLPHHAGRRYARLSGDWNPIHLWPWSARALGLAQPIIHGMHSLARCEALLGGQDGLAGLDARFTRPAGPTAGPACARRGLSSAGGRAGGAGGAGAARESGGGLYTFRPHWPRALNS